MQEENILYLKYSKKNKEPSGNYREKKIIHFVSYKMYDFFYYIYSHERNQKPFPG
jgi:hypothetical protein